ncbi:ABC transporter ATP-binding protein [Alkalicoccus daliensis]|uniref:Carbohydrate ABC transporter ATP-binding protein, CUT1 family n=1 Tax=Alkalicoccus daliensis TaxID=745820 RepID=A0A1H0EQZ1_9BACI|nr:ABC transporter ATP-binding protein [Alkalicoccus daliensis]SDN84782.1 carbohydrate ABC transporter ATP-binding protein, CUT1 family [Alkalicoccus daliensis]
MEEGSVKLKHISKSYDKQTFAVKETSVDIQPGEFFVLVGPSGCGKSTMLRMIAGLEEITAGEIYIHGKSANDTPPSRRRISMVFQNYALYPHLTVEENILFGLKVRKVPKKEQLRLCLEATDMLGMTEFLKRKPRELSGGQRQRVALARAVVSQMPICLMDEPLSNLDAKLRGQMRTEIRQLQQKLGITMIYVTHDQVEAMTMGDRMMVLKDGEVQQIGKPLDIYNNPANEFVANFIGAPPMNITEAEVQRDGSLRVHHNNSLTLLPASSNMKMHLGVRPEHILLTKTQETDWELSVKISTVEILGNETLLTFEVGETLWKAKIPGQWHYEKGQVTTIHINKQHIHLFDGRTGKMLPESVGVARKPAAVQGGASI